MALAKDLTVAQNLPLKERARIEGFPLTLYAGNDGATFTTDGGAATTVSIAAPGITRAFVIDTVMFSVNKNTRTQIQWSTSGFDAARTRLYQFVTAPGVPVIFQPDDVIRMSTPPEAFSAGWPGFRIRTLLDADKANISYAFSLSGWSITDDLDFLAPKSVLWIGDSITAGGTGPTVRENQYDWRVRRYYRDRGIRARLIQMSLSGSTSSQHAARLSQGWYDPIPGDLICYSAGANDPGQSVSAATYRANLDAAIAWKKLTHPQARMVVFGPTPNENDATETGLVAIRAQGAAAVAAANDPRIKFCDLGGAYDRKLASNYASSDVAGSRVHPSDAGHAAIWAVVAPFLDAQVPTI